jgi:PIN domain nuclease of toxin-antitoxin system
MLRAANLPDFHKDPADRIIIATALISGMLIVTGDGKFSQYGVKTIC